MLVNPSMENVILVLDDGGTWHPQLHAVWAAMGMVPPGPGLRPYKPIAGAAARLTGAAVTITLRRPAPADAYECGLTEADGPFPSEIVSQGGIMLAVTYVADPHSDDLARQFRDALRDEAACSLAGFPSPGDNYNLVSSSLASASLSASAYSPSPRPMPVSA